jgi:hypothetical protein
MYEKKVGRGKKKVNVKRTNIQNKPVANIKKMGKKK